MFRDDFSLDENVLYLNSGTQSICPRSVLDAVVRNLRQYERNPTDQLIQSWARLWQVHQELGAFLGARPEDLFLRPNITSAMNAFILGAPLSPQSEILISDTEYGAIVNTCRYRVERDKASGLTLRSFHVPGRAHEFENLTEDSLCELIVAQLSPSTRMLVLSHVMTGSGLVIPVEKLAAQTRARGVLLVIDGAHSVGALELDFLRYDDVDFYGGNLHKWALGPKGTAFGWAHPRHHTSLQPLEAGWTTFEALSPHNRFAQAINSRNATFTRRASILLQC